MRALGALTAVLLLLLASVLVLENCADSHPDKLEGAMAGMVGAPASSAIGRLGAADNIRPEASGTTYIWIDRTAAFPSNRRANRSAVAAELADRLKTDPDASLPKLACTVVMTTDVHEQIKRFHLTGDRTRCGSFAKVFEAEH